MNISYINTTIRISISSFLLILFSCQSQPSNKNYTKFKMPEQETKIAHKDSLFIGLKNFLGIPSHKCIVFLEGDCSVCLSHLPSTDNFLNQCTEIPHIYVVTTNSIKTFNAYCSLHNLDINIIYDKSNTIQRANQLINTNFILLNPANEIITKGNPLQESKTKTLYKKISKETEKQN